MSSTGKRLTEKEHSEIREMYCGGQATFGEIRHKFNLSKGGLSHIIKDLPKHGFRRDRDKRESPKSKPDPTRHWSMLKFEQIKTDRARRKFIIRELGHRCQICNQDEWRNLPIPLELDHTDGNPENNSRENCRVVCPNCHAQTDTYKGKNIGKVVNSKRKATLQKSIGKYR